MKRVWIFMIAILAAFSLVMACTTPKAIKSTEEAAQPSPPAEKKVEEEVITAQKPSEVTETEIKEETGKMVIEEVSFLKDIQFDFDDYSLTDQAKKILKQNAA
jgi:outer membrane protein OmpA-like peptidoglycan-associated protein